MEISSELLEKLAEAIHVDWMEGKLRDGWKYGTVIDKAMKIHNCLIPYERLAEADKESDRYIARGIPKLLESVGYKIVKMDEKC